MLQKRLKNSVVIAKKTIKIMLKLNIIIILDAKLWNVALVTNQNKSV